MKKIITSIAVAALVAAPTLASAHERQVFEIKGKQYEIVVGSLGEPLIVDDKSGVELMVSTLPSKKPVEGLNETLKVELIAGDKKKTLDFAAIYGQPGAYKAPFFPTVATTLSYRVFGEINETPFNVTFTCHAGGHAEAQEDTSRTEISEGVVRILKTGGFGCPSPKADMGFPEASADVQSLKETKTGSFDGATGVAAAAFALAALAFIRSRK